jgi:hypothetical protein
MDIFKIFKLKNTKQAKFQLDYLNFRRINDDRFNISENDLFPCLNDNTEFTSFDSHYVYHPAWASRVVKEINPLFHVDIASSLHFSSILSAFIDVKFYDYRPAKLNLSNLTSERIDLTNIFFDDNSQESVSCMHTIEHIGLGRYGDTIDPKGDIKAINELKRIVKPDGNLIIVVPVGKPKIFFNAHRVYSFEMIIELMNDFQLVEFSMVYDNKEFIKNANPKDVENQKYGCGCFWFIKR